MSIEIRPLTDAGSYVGFWAKGHHATADFIAVLEHDWGRTTTPDEVTQSYVRLVPCGDGGMWMIESKPGRGAFKVTACEYATKITPVKWSLAELLEPTP
jgi:hypothetical protein